MAEFGLKESKSMQQETLPIEEEVLQGKFDTNQCEDVSEEEIIQGKFETIQNRLSTNDRHKLLRINNEENSTGASVRQMPLQLKKENNTGLPDNLKAGVENLSGLSMDDVRVHYDSDKPSLVEALAYTRGNDIYIGPGQEKHLPHEAWHVVQQDQGRVQPTMQKKGMAVNNDDGLESEADEMGLKALKCLTVMDEEESAQVNPNEAKQNKDQHQQSLECIQLEEGDDLETAWEYNPQTSTTDYTDDADFDYSFDYSDVELPLSPSIDSTVASADKAHTTEVTSSSSSNKSTLGEKMSDDKEETNLPAADKDSQKVDGQDEIDWGKIKEVLSKYMKKESIAKNIIKLKIQSMGKSTEDIIEIIEKRVAERVAERVELAKKQKEKEEAEKTATQQPAVAETATQEPSPAEEYKAWDEAAYAAYAKSQRDFQKPKKVATEEEKEPAFDYDVHGDKHRGKGNAGGSTFSSNIGDPVEFMRKKCEELVPEIRQQSQEHVLQGKNRITFYYYGENEKNVGIDKSRGKKEVNTYIIQITYVHDSNRIEFHGYPMDTSRLPKKDGLEFKSATNGT